MGHYRVDMYETEADWKNHYKVLTSTAEEDAVWRKKLLEPSGWKTQAF